MIVLNSKKKARHYAQPPEYQQEFSAQANSVDDETISKIFQMAEVIIRKGIEERHIQGKSWPPFVPQIDLATATVRMSHADFLRAMSELRPLYEVCLGIKTDAEIERE